VIEQSEETQASFLELESFIKALKTTDMQPNEKLNDRLSVIASIYSQISTRHPKSEARIEEDDGTMEF